ncbi:GntR family transcriptional regulator [Oceanobacillus kimchii]|uniref:GntR family transcriptional regulator n=1 Tax=Oceanobacillus kimchii TaxID=746691 RepID=UPI000347426B|nr:GntR family transcriptional regulator [Oceanobacillus kimchii]
MADEMNLRIGDREMLHNRVCSVLREAILKGDFKPGERLVQTELANQIGVSRMPIREALRTLELEGLIVMQPHKGAVVREIKKEDIQEIYELRSVLEPMALKKSMEQFKQTDIDELSALHQTMLQTESDQKYVEYNANFHDILVSRCKSSRLLSFIEAVLNGFALDTPQIIPGQVQKSNKEHGVILEAIVERDADKASELLAQHIQRTGVELLQTLEKK